MLANTNFVVDQDASGKLISPIASTKNWPTRPKISLDSLQIDVI